MKCGPKGLNWYRKDFAYLISRSCEKSSDVIPEICNIKTSLNVSIFAVPLSVLQQFSWLQKCINLISYMLRYISKLKSVINVHKNDNINENNVNEFDSLLLSVDERNVAFNYSIHIA